MDLAQVDFKAIGEFLRQLVSSGGTFMIGLAALIGMIKLEKLLELFKRIKEARPTVYSLHNTVGNLDKRVSDVNEAIGGITRLAIGERLDKMTGSIDTTSKAIDAAVATLRGFGKRLDQQERQSQKDVPPTPSIAAGRKEPRSDAEGNQTPQQKSPWEILSDAWDDATMRLELKIDQQLQGRHGNTALKYDRFSRRNYAPIIMAARKDGMIDEPTATALAEINRLFLSWRPRNESTPVEIAGRAIVLLRTLSSILPADASHAEFEDTM